MYKLLDKWLPVIQNDLGCFKDITVTHAKIKQLIDVGVVVIEELEDESGIVCVAIHEDFLGNLCCNEIIVYVSPEHRGSVRRLYKLIKLIEDIAKDYECDKIQLGSTIGYNDESVIKFYKRLGYTTSGVIKDVHRS